MRRFCIYILTICLLFLGNSFVTKAQYCGSSDYINHLNERFPGFKQHVDAQYLQMVQESQRTSLYKLPPIDTLFTIPVVFHVVYNSLPQNISDVLIMDQLKILNEAFNRLNADTIHTRPIFQSVAGSARIKFVLATEDDEGNQTNGITRTLTSKATFNGSGQATQEDYVKLSNQGGKDGWDSDKYLNIWICNLNRTSGARALFGYAYPPVNADFWGAQYYKTKPYQGVVLHYEIIGLNNPSSLSRASYTVEKTAVHEVGHFLGLRHIWGDASWGQNGCSVDDYIDDTPNAIAQSSGCDHSKNTCSNDNLPDQQENYMDYSNAECTNMFTKQQIKVMRQNLVKLRPTLAAQEVLELKKPEISNSKIYPNPFGSNLQFFLDDPGLEKVTVTLFDMLGREVFSKVLLANDYTLNVNTDGIMIGLYKARVTSETKGVLIETQVLKSH